MIYGIKDLDTLYMIYQVQGLDAKHLSIKPKSSDNILIQLGKTLTTQLPVYLLFDCSIKSDNQLLNRFYDDKVLINNITYAGQACVLWVLTPNKDANRRRNQVLLGTEGKPSVATYAIQDWAMKEAGTAKVIYGKDTGIYDFDYNMDETGLFAMWSIDSRTPLFEINNGYSVQINRKFCETKPVLNSRHILRDYMGLPCIAPYVMPHRSCRCLSGKTGKILKCSPTKISALRDLAFYTNI